jgi:hypothetical protein
VGDGEEYLDTEAAGWSGELAYVRVPDTGYRSDPTTISGG